MYSFTNSKLPEPLMHMFTVNADVHNYNTRQKYYPHVNSRKTNMTSKTFIHLGPKPWQRLPYEIKNSKSSSSFNSKIRKFYVNAY